MQKNRRIKNEAGMLEFGNELAPLLRAGDVLALTGDLGAGKTTFSRGLIKAWTGANEVPSPTYTLIQTYDAPEFEIWHCDLYRLKHADEIYELGLLDAMEDALCLIEWPERMGKLLPKTALTVKIEFEAEGRMVRLSGPDVWWKRLKNV